MAGYYILAVVLFSSSVMATQHDATCTRYGFDVDNPGVSCADIYDNNPASHGNSGYYIVKTDHIHTVYCDMELECSGHKGGWMKIADYDTSRGDDCPRGWNKMTVSDNNIDVCQSPSNNSGCYSTNFFVYNVGYNKICGKVKGYQKGGADAFRHSPSSLDSNYVDGVSITLGSPRKHVWTYAVGLSDDNNINQESRCPCAKLPGKDPPAFVGNHYYCESGNTNETGIMSEYFTEDPLWDGNGCSAGDNCCTNTDQPWFFRQLVMKKSDDIEARLCTSEDFNDEAVLVEQIHLYVQ